MWISSFLVAALLVNVFATNTQNNRTASQQLDIEAEMDRIAEELMDSMIEAHSEPLHRTKRQAKADQKSFIDEMGVYRLQTITPVSHLCSPAIYTKFIDVAETLYAICVSEETKESPAEVIVGVYKEYIWNHLFRWYVAIPNGIEAFHFNGLLYVLVADSGKPKGTDLVKINLATGKLKVDHIVYSKPATSISIWKMKIDNNFHLAIANIPSHSNDLSSEISIYEWTNTYYDEYTRIPAYDVRDIEPFYIHDTPYLAIANYRRTLNNFEVDSEIFRYNLDKGWISHQKIRTYGALDWEFFTLGSDVSTEFFLAVANKEENDVSEAKSIIYKFAKDIFVPFQCLPIYRASSIASWSTKLTLVLAVASFDDAVHLFQYDGWRFVRSTTQYTQRALSYGVNSLVFHSIIKENETVPILSVSNAVYSDEFSIFEIGFKYENALQAWTEKSTEWCFNTLHKVESTDTDSLIRALDDVLYTDQVSPIVIEGDVYFEKGFEVSKLKTPVLKETITQETYDTSILVKLENIFKTLQEVDEKLQKFEDILEKALKTEGNQNVSGQFTFYDVDLDCQARDCQFESINTVFLNGENITDWSKNLVFLNADRIDGILNADKLIANNINVLGLIDGVDSSSLVTKSGNHIITGTKTFLNDVTATEVEVKGRVDGLRISPNDVLLTTGQQTVTGNLTFKEIDTSWLQTEFVNDVNLRSFLDDVVLSDQKATITGQKIFHDVVVDELQMVEGSTVNGVDLVDVWKNTLWKNGDQTITAPMTFNSIRLHKNLEVLQEINGVAIPGPRVVDITNSAFITEPQVFTQSTKIAHLEVLNSLNGLKMQAVDGNAPQLDIMLKSGNQIITGKKTFQTIHLDADSYVSGTVDGVHLSELKAMALHRDSVIDSNRTWIFNNLVIKGPLSVDTLSGINIEQIYNKALRLDEEVMQEITFKKPLFIEELESKNINGYDIERDFVLRNKPQHLTGTKTFREIILEDNSVVISTINNVNLKFLNETILRIGNQVLESKVFNQNVKINKLTIKGSINGIPIDEMVTLEGNEAMLHAIELKNVTFQEIEANNLEVAGTVNGIDVEEMMRNTLTSDGPQKVDGILTIKGAINVIADTNLNVGTINGIGVTELLEDVVLSDVPQVIGGVKVFKEPVTFENLDFKQTLDGVSEFDIKNWMLKDAPQTITNDVTFLNDVSARNIEVKGFINGINLTELDDSVVKVNSPSVIEGPVIFENTVLSLDDITLTGKVQGVDLSEEAVTISGDKVITGEKTFTSDLIVEGHLNVAGTIDGVSISDICENTLVIKKQQNISHLTIKGDVTLIGGGEVGGKISGISLDDLRDKVALDEDSFVIDGHKHFQNLTIEGPITIEGKFGGVDLHDLNQSYMSLTRDQDIYAPMEFEEVTFKDVLSVKNLNSKNNIVNGVDIQDLNNRILKIDGQQTVTAEHNFDEIIFADDVFVAGKVNGLDVPSGLMRRNKPNYIQTPKIFEAPVTVLGDLDMSAGKLIQDVDVSDWNKKAVLNEGQFEISGHKTFKNLKAMDVGVDGLLDGLAISEDALLMNYGDQVITGQKTIIGNVEIQGSLTVNGLINDVNLDNLASNTLRRDKENNITGEKYFTQTLTLQSLEAPTVAGVDVVELEKKINSQLDYKRVQNKLEEIEGVITSVKDAMNKQIVWFQYYELFQEFNIPRAYSWFYLWNKDCGELLLLSDNSSAVDSCSSIRLFRYNRDKNFVPLQQELSTSHASSVKSLVIEDKTFLFVTNLNPRSACSDKKITGDVPESEIYSWRGGRFELFQSIPMNPVIYAEVFSDDTLSCVVYVELRHTKVYCSDFDEEFTLRETILTIGVRKASIIESHGNIVLAVAAENLSPRSNYIEDSKVDIYFWNSELASFSNPVQGISTKFVQSLLLMSHFTDYSYDLYLVIGGGRIPKIQEEPKISIFKFEKSTAKFEKYQEIKENGELKWLVLQTGELILFVLNKERGHIKIYEHKGASGFSLIDTINSIGTVDMHPFIRHHDKEDGINHYLALAGPHTLMAQPAQGDSYAKILKSKFKGGRYFINN